MYLQLTHLFRVVDPYCDKKFDQGGTRAEENDRLSVGKVWTKYV